MNIYLVCEGKPDGLDVRVLDLIIAQKYDRMVQIEPAGGSGSLGGVASWLEERSPLNQAHSVQDRDFRPLVEIEQIWQRPNQKRWVWRRHEIENYLLDPRVVADVFRALKADGVRGTDTLADDSDAIFGLLQKLAQPMFEDHVGWLTYWDLVSRKRNVGDTRLLWPDPHLQSTSGSQYPGQAEWLHYLRSECVRLKEACERVSKDVTFDELDIVKMYEDNLSKVAHSDFLTSGRFLRDMGGKELMSALCSYVNQTGVPGLSRSLLEEELLKALDRLYEPGFFEPDDFAQLAGGL